MARITFSFWLNSLTPLISIYRSSNNEHTEKTCHAGLLDEILTYAKSVLQGISSLLEDKSKPNAVFACPECEYFRAT